MDEVPDATAGAPADPAGPTGSREGEADLRTFLIADIRGYTGYTAAHGSDAAAELATRFAAIVREVVERHDGSLLELRGDEALAVFVLARRALGAAVDLQARVAAELPQGVGIGLDAGEAIRVEGGYRGSALNLAARVCARAGPGETIASESVVHLAGKVDGIGYTNPRTYRLKGIGEPVRAVHVVPAEQGSTKPLRYGREGGRDRRPLFAAAVGVVGLSLAAVALSGVFERRPAPTSSPVTGALPSPASTRTAGTSPTTSPAASAGPLGDAELPLIAFVDPDSGRVTDTRAVHAPSDTSGFAGDTLWLETLDPNAFQRIDPTSHEFLRSISVPVAQAGFSWFEGDTLWVVDTLARRVVAIDARTGVVADEVSISSAVGDDQQLVGVTIGANSLWVSLVNDGPGDNQVIRLDPATGDEQARIDVDGVPEILAFGDGAVWFTGNGEIGRIDIATNRASFTSDLAGGSPGEEAAFLPNIAFGGGAAWTADDAQGKVWKVDRTGRPTEFDIGVGAHGLALLDETMWVSAQDTGKLVGIDVTTGEQREIVIGHLTLGVAADGDELMVAVDRTPEERIADLDGDVLTIAAPGDPFHNPDPPVNGSFEHRQLEYITCAGLLRYRDAPAPEGWELVPEVAADMPDISADGRTYTFTVRPGFAFSPPSDEPVMAETYRYTIERALSPALDSFFGSRWLSDIDGAEAYISGESDSLSGVQADGDQLTIHLTEPSADFLERLTLPYFCPVPRGTPVVPGGLDPTPPLSSAGPYYMAERHGEDLVIVKPNPNYSGDREQPWDAIAWRIGFTPNEVIARVDNGLAGAATGSPFDPLLNAQSDRAQQWGPVSDAAASGDQRWFGAPRFGMEFLFLNPERVFADPDVRRAVALAIDRPALAAWLGEQPFHGLLAPSVPGSLPADTPVPPPDVGAAIELMAGRTATVVMGVFPDCPECDGVAETVAGSLAPIGIEVEVRIFDDLIDEAFDPRSELDLYNAFLDTDYPDPVSILRQHLGENRWIGRDNLAELARLKTLDGEERIDAAAAFATKLSNDEAYAIPYAYPVYPMYLGEDVGCGFVQPAIGAVDLLSLCPEP
ncbi:MAG: ABC transporter substrate-binding protein [Candidatus Limnocylindria bacterium]